MLSMMIHSRYKIIQTLGTGAFGQTYLVRDTSRPEQTLCVAKQLKPKVNDPKVWNVAKALFEREVETLRQLGVHEQIPQMLDAFEADQGFYLVQEYIDGKTIREELSHHKVWTEAEVTLLLQEVLTILEFVHCQGIIHRDIKPENIIRRTCDQKLFLIDFGAVKQVSLSRSEQTSLTIVHTCGYSPPEQLEGLPELSSDLYALGMTCMEALTGTKPELLKQGRNTTTRDIDWPRTIEVSNEFKFILDKMVRIDSRDRYPSVHPLMRDLNCLPSKSTNTYTPTEIFTHPTVHLTSDLNTLAEKDTEQSLEISRSFASRTRSKQNPNFNQISKALIGSKANKKVKKFVQVINKTDQYIKENVIFLLCLMMFTFLGVLITYFTIQTISNRDRSVQKPQASSAQKEYQSNDKKENIEQLSIFEEQGLFHEHQSSIKFLGFTSDGRILISGSEEGSVKFRNLQTQAIQLLTQTQNKILAIAKSSNREMLAIATEGKKIEIWDLKTHKRIEQLATDQLIWSLALSPDSRVLAAGGLGSIKVWKMRQSKPDQPKLKLSENYTFIFNDTEPIQATAISSTSPIVIGGNSDGRIKLFHLLNKAAHAFNL
jgi:serine/threonine protein kinase